MGGFLSGKTSLTTVQTADIANDAVTLAKMAAGTDGNVITYDTSGDPAVVATGTSGHFLKSAGAGAVPTFAAAGGAVQQVVQLYKTDVETQAGDGTDSFHDISGYALAITPTKAGSKILVDINPVIGNTVNYGALDVQADIDGAGYAAIGAPDTAGSRVKGWVGNLYANGANGTICWPFPQKFLWSPSYSLTDVLTVKCRWSAGSGSTVTLNRSYASTDSNVHFVATSSITLWEIN